MSYRRDDRRRESSGHRRSDSYSRSRRSPSPSRSSRAITTDRHGIPDRFGGNPMSMTTMMNINVDIIARMKDGFVKTPLGVVSDCIKENKKIKVLTRDFKEVRGILTGYPVAFDKHWNMVLNDVDEKRAVKKKAKTPFLRTVEANEVLQEMQPKVPRKKKAKSTSDPASDTEVQIIKPKVEEKSGTDEPAGEKKKKKKTRVKYRLTARHLDTLFIRGDNIVLVSILEPDEEKKSE